tara:strand:+ start:1125 stop:2339 length:1215 start_codon:yes stop_codon:yes gene_type:complete
MNKKEIKWQKQVLKDFKKKSPSKIKIESKKIFKKYLVNHKNLFENNLKFPIEMFDKKKVLDLGCGTGEVDIVLSSFGAKCLGVDFNDISIDRANKLKKKYKIKNVNFKKSNIEDYKVKKNFYDISISFGVIAHVYSPENLFKKLVQSTKKNGYIILGYVEDAGLIQRLLHRAIIRKLKISDDKKVFSFAKKLFKEHIARSIKFGLRSEEGIINDYLINQAYVGNSMRQIRGWEKKYKLKIYSKCPDASIPFRIDPGFQNHELRANIKDELFAISALRSIFAQKSDETIFYKMFKKKGNFISPDINKFVVLLTKILQRKNNSLKNKELGKLKKFRTNISKKILAQSEVIKNFSNKNYDLLSDEIINILIQISKENFSFKTLGNKVKFLFRGYNGLGTTYIIFKKK